MKSSKKRDLFIQSPTPNNRKTSFSILERIEGKSKTIKSHQLDEINARFRAKKLSFEEARSLVQHIVYQIAPKPQKDFHSANQRLLERYWQEIYSNRNLVDFKSAKNRLHRAIAVLGNLPLEGSTRESLQSAVDRQLTGNKHRTVVSTLNQLLRFVRSDFKLRGAREEFREVRSISQNDFEKLVTFIKDSQIRLLHQVAFGTGLRAGELFALTPDSIKDQFVLVKAQIDVSGIRRATKNRKVRSAYVLKNYRKQLIVWASIPMEERLKFRKRSISKITRYASRKAIGHEITFHDLRHSYVRYLLDRGDSLTRVAKYIGDGLKVTEQFYAGFLATTDEMKLTALLDS